MKKSIMLIMNGVIPFHSIDNRTQSKNHEFRLILHGVHT